MDASPENQKPASPPEPSGAAPGAFLSNSKIDLPLVSIIIVNFNYGRFLAAAVDSIARQTYPRIECIIVDNASTDETAAVLAGIEARDPKVAVIRRATNGGQTPAALDGLAAANGAYVIFLDADDLLLPDCVETHIFVHLSLRIHVGFTSGDMLQLVGDQVVLGTENGFNQLMRSDPQSRRGPVRAYRHAGEPPWPGEGFDRTILDRLCVVPLETRHWAWSPTSGNCFRRDALRLFSDNPALGTLRTGTDLYFCLGINAVSGSVLIDAAVAVYRLHGGNMYSARAQLDHVLSYEPGCPGDSNALAKAILVDHLIERAERFVGRGWTPFDFLQLLRRLDCDNPDKEGPGWARRSRVSSAIVKHFRAIAPLFGTLLLLTFLARFGVPSSRIARLAMSQASRGRRTPKL